MPFVVDGKMLIGVSRPTLFDQHSPCSIVLLRFIVAPLSVLEKGLAKTVMVVGCADEQVGLGTSGMR